MQVITKFIEKQTVATPVKQAAHHIVVIDCSGSMGSSLPKIRTALKNKIPTMVQPQDRLSIVWFSGRNQCGVLMEAVQVSTLTDLSTINNSIDRFLTPVGMTAFIRPLETVVDLAKRNAMPTSMFFMTDGQPTEGEYRKDILSATKTMGQLVDSSTFVEFGWYADHNLLMEMADTVSGSVIQSDDFEKYVQQMETALGGKVGGKKIEVAVEDGVEAIIVPTVSGFMSVKVEDGLAFVPEDTEVYSYTKFKGEVTSITDPMNAMFVIASLVQRGKVDVAIQIAEKIGDVEIYNALNNAFSKQDYANLVEMLIDFGYGARQLFSTAPKNTALKVKADAYNVLQLLIDLSSIEGNQLHIGHSSFKYNKIGPANKTADVNGFTPKFESIDGDAKANITSLKFDEDRPNVSILVKREGVVMLPDTPLLASNKFHTFAWRNYTIVKDGIINVQYLPLILTAKTHALLSSHGLINEPFVAGKTYVINTKNMPIINRKMVEDVSAEKLASKALQVFNLKCIQKVVNAKLKEDTVKDAKFVELYGQDATDFLKEHGITEGGFSPKKINVDSTDSYMSKELTTKLKGLSSIPKIDDVQKAIDAKKALSLPLQYLQEGIGLVEQYGENVADLKKKIKDNINESMAEIIKSKFSIIIGKKWFKEFGSMEENTWVTKCPATGKEVQCTFDLIEKEIS